MSTADAGASAFDATVETAESDRLIQARLEVDASKHRYELAKQHLEYAQDNLTEAELALAKAEELEGE